MVIHMFDHLLDHLLQERKYPWFVYLNAPVNHFEVMMFTLIVISFIFFHPRKEYITFIPLSVKWIETILFFVIYTGAGILLKIKGRWQQAARHIYSPVIILGLILFYL